MPRIEPSDVTIRVLGTEDFAAIVEIDRLVLGRARPEYYERKMRHVIEGPDHIVSSLAAEVDGKLVGFLMGQVTDGEFGTLDTTAILDTIGIHPDYQRRGVARLLFDEYTRNMKAIGVGSIRTFIDWNAWDLIRFFDSLGFGPVATLNLERRL